MNSSHSSRNYNLFHPNHPNLVKLYPSLKGIKAFPIIGDSHIGADLTLEKDFMDFNTFRQKFMKFLMLNSKESMRRKLKNIHIYYNIMKQLWIARRQLQSNNLTNEVNNNSLILSAIHYENIIKDYLTDLKQFEQFLNSPALQPITVSQSQNIPFIRHNKLILFMNYMQQHNLLYDEPVALHRDSLSQLQINLEQTFNFRSFLEYYAEQQFNIAFQRIQDDNLGNKKKIVVQKKLKLKTYFNGNNSSTNIINNSQQQQIRSEQDTMAIKKFTTLDFKPLEALLVQLQKKYFQYLSQDVFLMQKEDHICKQNIQLNLMMKGFWFGYHQKTYAMSYTHINLGPNSIQWFIVRGQDQPRLKQFLKQDFNIDLDYDDISLWSSNENWLNKKKIPLIRLVQNIGDFILIGSSTLYWYKSLDTTLSLSIKSMPKASIISNLKLYNQNQKNNIHNTVPLKSFTMKYLQRQIMVAQWLTIKILITNIHKWLSQQEILINDKEDWLSISQSNPRYLSPYSSYCSQCNRQIFNFYRRVIDTQICIKCLQCSQQGIIYYKYDYQALRYLLEHAQRIISFQNLCNGLSTQKIKDKEKKLCIQSNIYKQELNAHNHQIIINKINDFSRLSDPLKNQSSLDNKDSIIEKQASIQGKSINYSTIKIDNVQKICTFVQTKEKQLQSQKKESNIVNQLVIRQQNKTTGISKQISNITIPVGHYKDPKQLSNQIEHRRREDSKDSRSIKKTMTKGQGYYRSSRSRGDERDYRNRHKGQTDESNYRRQSAYRQKERREERSRYGDSDNQRFYRRERRSRQNYDETRFGRIKAQKANNKKVKKQQSFDY